MVTNQPVGEGPSHGVFSVGLASDISEVLGHSLLVSGPGQHAVLHALAHRVCAEARELALPPEKMLIAIKHLFERMPQAPGAHSEQRRLMFERFISNCIDDYFK